MSRRSSKCAPDNRANQLNPTHPAYQRSRGAPPDEAQRMASQSPFASDSASAASQGALETSSDKPKTSGTP